MLFPRTPQAGAEQSRSGRDGARLSLFPPFGRSRPMTLARGWACPSVCPSPVAASAQALRAGGVARLSAPRHCCQACAASPDGAASPCLPPQPLLAVAVLRDGGRGTGCDRARLDAVAWGASSGLLFRAPFGSGRPGVSWAPRLALKVIIVPAGRSRRARPHRWGPRAREPASARTSEPEPRLVVQIRALRAQVRADTQAIVAVVGSPDCIDDQVRRSHCWPSCTAHLCHGASTARRLLGWAIRVGFAFAACFFR